MSNGTSPARSNSDSIASQATSIFSNPTVWHAAGEAVALCGIAYKFYQQANLIQNLEKQIKQLKDVLQCHEANIKQIQLLLAKSTAPDLGPQIIFGGLGPSLFESFVPNKSSNVSGNVSSNVSGNVTIDDDDQDDDEAILQQELEDK